MAAYEELFQVGKFMLAEAGADNQSVGRHKAHPQHPAHIKPVINFVWPHPPSNDVQNVRWVGGEIAK